MRSKRGPFARRLAARPAHPRRRLRISRGILRVRSFCGRPGRTIYAVAAWRAAATSQFSAPSNKPNGGQFNEVHYPRRRPGYPLSPRYEGHAQGDAPRPRQARHPVRGGGGPGPGRGRRVHHRELPLQAPDRQLLHARPRPGGPPALPRQGRLRRRHRGGRQRASKLLLPERAPRPRPRGALRVVRHGRRAVLRPPGRLRRA